MKMCGWLAIGVAWSLAVGCSTPPAPSAVVSGEGRVSPFLMFQDGNAEAAMDFYVSVFPDSRVVSVERHGAGAPAAEGQIEMGTFEIMGQQVRCSDSPPVHDFDFTPSMSLYVVCTSEAELDGYAARLSEGGGFMMPPGDYGFSQRFAFLKDRYGVSWQLNLPNERGGG
ncbi:MAG: VOC family protein [Planctomycetota bacterium]